LGLTQEKRDVSKCTLEGGCVFHGSSFLLIINQAFVEVSHVAFDCFWAPVINFLKQFIYLSLGFVCCVVGL